MSSSPAQRMFCRRARTLLPTNSSLLKPKIQEDVKEKLIKQKSKETKYYNRTSKELPPEGQERLYESPLNKVTENGSGSKLVLKNKLTFGRTKSGPKMANCTEEIVDIFASPRNHLVSRLKPDLSCNPNTTRRAHHLQQLNQLYPKPQVNQSKTPLLIYPSKQSRC